MAALKVIFPADRNGVVGIKPSLGRTSCRGVIPESHNFDVVGTFGKSVADAATALAAILEVDGTGDLPPQLSLDCSVYLTIFT